MHTVMHLSRALLLLQMDLKAHERTNSMWTYVLQPHVLSKFTNPQYQPPATHANARNNVFIHQNLVGSQANSSSNNLAYTVNATTRTPSPPVEFGAPLNRPPPLASVQPPQASAVGPVGAIWPSTRRVRFWERYFCRWDMDAHPRVGTGEVWRDNWV
jgi:hypothetical protein